MIMHPELEKSLQKRQALKIISGLTNFDTSKVSAIAKAAQAGGATFVDIAASPSLVRQVRSLIDLPICVSAVEAQLLADAVEAGADLVEIGNFDAFYAQGRRFAAPEVLALTQETRALLPHTPLCVTVPHILPLDEQVALAEKLVEAGANLIQTEGGTSSHPTHPGTLGLIEKAAPTLAAAYSISRAVSVPVICASGLSTVTVPMAITAGALGVGVGSAINQLNDEVAMVAAVRALVESLENSSVRVNV
ncbi:DUF561 domain-containing protein [Crocosphaera sp. Alani8]|uniref:DUF561 domain-containing protein n=2 Tax=Crocosphaera sp. Alani8 TaxID=3038952 RepID=UPI00313D8A91